MILPVQCLLLWCLLSCCARGMGMVTVTTFSLDVHVSTIGDDLDLESKNRQASSLITCHRRTAPPLISASQVCCAGLDHRLTC